MKRWLILGVLLPVFSSLLSAQPATKEPPEAKKSALKTAKTDGTVWHDPRAAPFRLTGFPWFKQDKVYRRLPVDPDRPIPAAVNSLANNTSGGQIHFQTDSPKILVRVELHRASGMNHMPATGQSGFDLYAGEPGNLRYIATSRFSSKATSYNVTLFSGAQTNRNIVLNFPLYNGVKSVEVGLAQKASLSAPPEFASKGSIVVYGTSITQGGCAARPGMAYPNILSRRLNLEFVNLGFSGSGRGEPELAKLIHQLDDKKMVILDYQANAGVGIRNTLETFIDIIRKDHPDLPILLISKILYARELYTGTSTAGMLTTFQKELVERKRTDGDKHLHFLDGSTLLGERADECTVDGVHPTDLGFMRMANGIEPVLKEILGTAP